MKNSINKFLAYFQLFILVVVAIGFAVSMLRDAVKTSYNCRPTAASWDSALIELAIDDYSPAFEPLNEFREIYSWNPINLRKEALFFVGSINQREDVQLVSYDIQDGQVNWQVCETQVVEVDDSRVYVGHNDLGAFVVAYSISDGTKLWHTKVDGRVVSTIEVTPIGLLVTTNDHGNNRYYLLNPETGKKRETFKTDGAKNSFFVENDQIVYQTTEQEIISFGDIQWKTRLGYSPYVFDTKIIVNNDIVLIDIRDHSMSQIIVLDANSGNILWQTDKYIKSDISITKGVVFFVTKSSDLLALDLQTGVELGYVSFTPSLMSIPDHDFVNAHPRVTSDEDIVVVYFDIGRQIFTFNFVPRVGE